MTEEERDQLEAMLRGLLIERPMIRECMGWCCTGHQTDGVPSSKLWLVHAARLPILCACPRCSPAHSVCLPMLLACMLDDSMLMSTRLHPAVLQVHYEERCVG